MVTCLVHYCRIVCTSYTLSFLFSLSLIYCNGVVTVKHFYIFLGGGNRPLGGGFLIFSLHWDRV